MKTKSLATLGGGCFWCLDAVYRRVKGVELVVSGYAGGNLPNPSYDLVQSGRSGHAEVVQLSFDPQIVSYRTLIDIFWVIHDPTSINKQGRDEGPQYRSVIFYHDDQQKEAAEASRSEAQKAWDKSIVTEVVPFTKFYQAEAEHQDFYTKHPEFGYCQVVINPKLHKLQEKFNTSLKD